MDKEIEEKFSELEKEIHNHDIKWLTHRYANFTHHLTLLKKIKGEISKRDEKIESFEAENKKLKHKLQNLTQGLIKDNNDIRTRFRDRIKTLEKDQENLESVLTDFLDSLWGLAINKLPISKETFIDDLVSFTERLKKGAGGNPNSKNGCWNCEYYKHNKSICKGNGIFRNSDFLCDNWILSKYSKEPTTDAPLYAIKCPKCGRENCFDYDPKLKKRKCVWQDCLYEEKDAPAEDIGLKTYIKLQSLEINRLRKEKKQLREEFVKEWKRFSKWIDNQKNDLLMAESIIEEIEKYIKEWQKK